MIFFKKLLILFLITPSLNASSWCYWKKKTANPLDEVTQIKPIQKIILDYTYDIEDALNAVLKSNVQELNAIFELQKFAGSEFTKNEIDELKISSENIKNVKVPKILRPINFDFRRCLSLLSDHPRKFPLVGAYFGAVGGMINASEKYILTPSFITAKLILLIIAGEFAKETGLYVSSAEYIREMLNRIGTRLSNQDVITIHNIIDKL